MPCTPACSSSADQVELERARERDPRAADRRDRAERGRDRPLHVAAPRVRRAARRRPRRRRGRLTSSPGPGGDGVEMAVPRERGRSPDPNARRRWAALLGSDDLGRGAEGREDAGGDLGRGVLGPAWVLDGRRDQGACEARGPRRRRRPPPPPWPPSARRGVPRRPRLPWRADLLHAPSLQEALRSALGAGAERTRPRPGDRLAAVLAPARRDTRAALIFTVRRRAVTPRRRGLVPRGARRGRGDRPLDAAPTGGVRGDRLDPALPRLVGALPPVHTYCARRSLWSRSSAS